MILSSSGFLDGGKEGPDMRFGGRLDPSVECEAGPGRPSPLLPTSNLSRLCEGGIEGPTMRDAVAAWTLRGGEFGVS